MQAGQPATAKYIPACLQIHSHIASVSIIPLYQQLVGAGGILGVVEILHTSIAGTGHLQMHMTFNCSSFLLESCVLT